MQSMLSGEGGKSGFLHIPADPHFSRVLRRNGILGLRSRKDKVQLTLGLPSAVCKSRKAEYTQETLRVARAVDITLLHLCSLNK